MISSESKWSQGMLFETKKGSVTILGSKSEQDVRAVT